MNTKRIKQLKSQVRLMEDSAKHWRNAYEIIHGAKAQLKDDLRQADERNGELNAKITRREARITQVSQVGQLLSGVGHAICRALNP